MKLNPFNVNYFNKLFIFHEKNESMILKIYIFVEFLKLQESMKIIQEKLKDFKDISYCIQIHYEYPRRTYLFSVNCKVDGLFLKIHDYEAKFQEIDRELENICIEINDPYKNVYLTLFSGIDAFLMKIVKNQVVLHDPLTQNNILNIALFHVKLSNLVLVPNFFDFFTDLTLKMKLKFEIYFFIKSENDKFLIQSIFAFIEKNHHRFLDMLEKFSNMKELRIMLDGMQVNKKRITELFIRKLIDEKFDFKIDENLELITKYLSDQQITTNDDHEIECPAPEMSVPVISSTIVQSISPNKGKIEDAARNLYWESLSGSNVQGNYLDLQCDVFDDGTTIFFLVHELDIRIFLDFIKKDIMNRNVKLIFIDPAELEAFIQVMPSQIQERLEFVTLEEFKYNNQDILVQS
jgi:hypothetical protein